MLKALATCAAARQPFVEGASEKMTVRMNMRCSQSPFPCKLGRLVLSLSASRTLAPDRRFTAAYPPHWSNARATQPPSWEPHRRAPRTFSGRYRRRVAPEWRLKKEGAAGDGRRSQGSWRGGASGPLAAERHGRQTAEK
jgi:hypothetical protein